MRERESWIDYRDYSICRSWPQLLTHSLTRQSDSNQSSAWISATRRGSGWQRKRLRWADRPTDHDYVAKTNIVAEPEAARARVSPDQCAANAPD